MPVSSWCGALRAAAAVIVAVGCSSPRASGPGEKPAGGGAGASGGGAGPSRQLATIRAIEEAFEARDRKKFGALFTDDVTVNVAGRPDVRGRAGAEEGFARVTSTWGKVRYHARRVFTKDDVAIVEFVMTGTHEAPVDGVAATHARVGWHGAEVDRFAADGRIKQRHLYFDQATSRAQIAKKAEARPVPDEIAAVEHVAARGTKDEEANLALLEQINHAWEGKDEARWISLFADDVEWNDFAFAKPARGKDAVRGYFRTFTTAFPEVTSSTLSAWAIGSFVIEEGTFTGTHKGTYRDIPATSRQVVLYELNIVELAGGKIKRGWTYSNELDLREQLGVAAPAAGR